jgi:SNF2 family DNA or RNA helicase
LFKGRLHPYQLEPVQRFTDRGSLLLAFGCGTGKTVIAIAAAEQLMTEGYVSCCLVICPASLKYQWADKIKEFTTSPVLVIDGDKSYRRDQYSRCLFYNDVSYIIVSYDSVLYDYEQLAKIRPDMVVCDEITAIKSFKAQRSKKIKKLFKDVPYRLGLTATPIENRPEELYSIMQWVDDSVLGRYDLFEKTYVTRNSRKWVTGYKNLDVLHDRMGTSLSRKTRHDPEVRPYLPDVDTGNWEVPMSPEVRAIYRVIAADMVTELEELKNFGEVDVSAYYSGVDESAPPGKLMAMHMCMEMLLNHPDLLIWSGQEYGKPDTEFGCAYAYNIWQSGYLDTVTESAKMKYLLRKLDELLSDAGSKVIIFSKYKFMLQLIADVLPCKSVTFHGDMNAKQKERAKEIFRTDPDCLVFLSSYAGGYGQDLYMADYLVNYDLPWSFGQQDQINSRHVRVSSEFDKVYVRNLITDNSIEGRKLRMLNRKRVMSDTVIDGGSVSDVATDNDLLRNHLENFLGEDLDKE